MGEVTGLCPCHGQWARAPGQHTGLSRAYPREGLGDRGPLMAPGPSTGRGLIVIPQVISGITVGLVVPHAWAFMARGNNRDREATCSSPPALTV